MKVCRFNEGRTGVVRGDRVFDVTALVPAASGPLAALRALPSEAIEAEVAYRLDTVRLLAPVRAPGKVVAAPVNYHAHLAEMTAAGMMDDHIPDIGRAGLFLKAPSSIVGPSEGIRLAFPDRRTDYELELVAVIGKAASKATVDGALGHVAGYCLGLDITLRGPEDRSFRKSIDSYSVLGPWLTTADEIADPQALRLLLRQNGQVRQDASTADMIYGVARLIAFASSFYTLHPGDVIFTGTPQGVGPLAAGDDLVAECTELGAMTVAVTGQQP